MDNNQETQIRTDIELLKRDVSSINQVIDKLDLTIDKLAEVSNGLNRMITVHESQLERQDDEQRELFQLVEQRRIESKEQYETLHKRVSDQKEYLENQIEKIHEDVMDELKQLRKDQMDHHAYMADRLSKLEKWKWFVVGIGTAIGFILSEMTPLANLFQ